MRNTALLETLSAITCLGSWLRSSGMMLFKRLDQRGYVIMRLCVIWRVLPEDTETFGDCKWFDLFASRVSGLAVWLHPVWATPSA